MVSITQSKKKREKKTNEGLLLLAFDLAFNVFETIIKVVDRVHLVAEAVDPKRNGTLQKGQKSYSWAFVIEHQLHFVTQDIGVNPLQILQ